MKIRILITSFVSLLSGTIIYLLFRTASIKVFNWFNFFNIDFLNTPIRKTSFQYAPQLPDWFLYSLPDGLWMASYVCLMICVWNFKINYNSLFWISIVPVIAIFSEIGQLLRWIPGTFDFSDLLFYLSGLILPLLYVIRTYQFKNFKNF